MENAILRWDFLLVFSRFSREITTNFSFLARNQIARKMPPIYPTYMFWLLVVLRERSEGCKVCHPQFSNGILLPVNWRVHVFKLPVMIDLVSDEVHTVAKSLKIYSSEIRGL